MALALDNNGPGVEAAPDVLCLRTVISNVCMVGKPGAKGGEWVLVDAGVEGSGPQIRQAALERFGRDRPPALIVLTHGHWDHVGALRELCEHWDVPVYAHERELPYLTGQAQYPQQDPTVGGGMIARLSPLMPNGGTDVSGRVRALPDAGAIPAMPGWRWIFTPGHTPGHIALFRAADRVLLSGDAFVTVEQESASAVLRQEPEIDGPPAYWTVDWPTAKWSVAQLAKLRPLVVAAGHGLPMRGSELQRRLETLVTDFDRIAVPPQGRWVPEQQAGAPIPATPPTRPEPPPVVSPPMAPLPPS